jgi:predicted DNA-binding transcriptional regulator AlpA
MNSRTQLIYRDLQTRYKKASLNKKELAHELGLSPFTIDGYIQKGIGIPNYKKLGNAKNATVIFNIIDVADYLSQTIKTA